MKKIAALAIVVLAAVGVIRVVNDGPVDTPVHRHLQAVDR